jgi:hypothetical protein
MRPRSDAPSSLPFMPSFLLIRILAHARPDGTRTQARNASSETPDLARSQSCSCRSCGRGEWLLPGTPLCSGDESSASWILSLESFTPRLPVSTLPGQLQLQRPAANSYACGASTSRASSQTRSPTQGTLAGETHFIRAMGVDTSTAVVSDRLLTAQFRNEQACY